MLFGKKTSKLLFTLPCFFYFLKKRKQKLHRPLKINILATKNMQDHIFF